MCMCEKNNVNGEPGYKRPGDPQNVRQPLPPKVDDNDEMMYDLPGRCGKVDSHSYHFIVTKNYRNALSLYVRHGGGQEKFFIGYIEGKIRTGIAEVINNALDDDARYWFILTLYRTLSDARREARNEEREGWKRAARENRLKLRTRKGHKYAEILPEILVSEIT